MSRKKIGHLEEELEALLRTSVDVAVERLIQEDFRNLLWAFVRKKTSGKVQPFDINVLCKEIIEDFWKAACDPGFDSQRPLRLLYKIANDKCCTVLRRREHQAKTNHQDFLDQDSAPLAHSRPAGEYDPTARAESAELVEHVQRFIGSLPDHRDRLLAEVFFENHEDLGDRRDKPKRLAAILSEITGDIVKPKEVTRRWTKIRDTMRRYLIQVGLLEMPKAS